MCWTSIFAGVAAFTSVVNEVYLQELQHLLQLSMC